MSPELPAKDLLRRVGDMHQLAGIDLVEALEGPERGVRKARVRTGGGLEFSVNIDRGFDIGEARLNGLNMTWRSPVGSVHPYAHQGDAKGWLRRFPGGLLTTCGLDNAGPASGGRPMHGRFSQTPAKLLSARASWQGERFVLELSGEVQDYRLFGDHLVLIRRITTEYGARTLRLADRIENRGYRRSPLMLLYHCNFGYPLLDEGAELHLKSRVTPRDEAAAQGLKTYKQVHAPAPDYAEQVFIHEVEAGTDGHVLVGLVNRKLPVTAYLRYDKRQLPHFMQWRQLGEGAYVLGLEPCTCGPLGFEGEAEAGRVIWLEPGETHEISLEFGFVSRALETGEFFDPRRPHRDL
jgi:galactose mutarotase-like enzyme